MARSGARSPLLVVLPALVALQGLALVVIAAYYVAELARDEATNTSGVLFAALVALVVGVGVLAAARGLGRGRRWARSPVLVVQLLLALVAVGPDGVVHGGSLYAGALLLLWAVVVAWLLFAPAVSSTLEE